MSVQNDPNADSDELQALFDSMATEGEVEEKSVEAAPVVQKNDAATSLADGDNPDLQSLFDSIAGNFDDVPEEVLLAGQADSASSVDSDKSEAVFNRIGQMTRKVHDTLRALGSDSSLKDAVLAMPDARERLDYITQMTEQAASRVLNATDIAQPLQDRIHNDANALGARWDKLFANEISVDEFKSLAYDTRQYLGRTTADSKAVSEQLLEIMMAQDFQDLTGQVIKKVVELAQVLESQLLGVLLEVTPPEKLATTPKTDSLMNGPVINAEGEDVVTTQGQVDDLLDSLGF